MAIAPLMNSAVCSSKAGLWPNLVPNAQPLALYSKSDHEVYELRKLAAEVLAPVDYPA
jgi:hypothetical protein